MCMYVQVLVCMCTYMYVCACTSMYVYVHVSMCMCRVAWVRPLNVRLSEVSDLGERQPTLMENEFYCIDHTWYLLSIKSEEEQALVPTRPTRAEQDVWAPPFGRTAVWAHGRLGAGRLGAGLHARGNSIL